MPQSHRGLLKPTYFDDFTFRTLADVCIFTKFVFCHYVILSENPYVLLRISCFNDFLCFFAPTTFIYKTPAVLTKTSKKYRKGTPGSTSFGYHFGVRFESKIIKKQMCFMAFRDNEGFAFSD